MRGLTLGRKIERRDSKGRSFRARNNTVELRIIVEYDNRARDDIHAEGQYILVCI